MKKPWRGASRGQIIVLLALVISSLIVMAGLVVDIIFVYTVKTRLTTATDATALAVTRALGRGTNQAQQEAELLRVAGLIFDTNFPHDLLLNSGTARIANGPTIAGPNLANGGLRIQDASIEQGTREVRLSTSVTVPTFFLRILGRNEVVVASAATAARRDVNVMMVVDRSASLAPWNADAWTSVVSAAKLFVNQFDNTRDKVGLVTFGTGAGVEFSPATNFKTSIEAKLDGVQMAQNAATNASHGLWLGLAELRALNESGPLNVLVFFTDGQPSAITANFNTVQVPQPADPGGPFCAGAQAEAVLWTQQAGSQFYEMGGFQEPSAPSPVIVHSTSFGANTVTHDSLGVGGCTMADPARVQLWKVFGGPVEHVFAPGCLPETWPTTHTAPAGTVSGTLDFKTGPYTVDMCSPTLHVDDNVWGNEVYRGTQVWNAAKNASLNLMADARRDPTLRTRVFSIGLGGFGFPADADFLGRIANDANNPGAVGTAQAGEFEGKYIYAPTKSQLSQAFRTVANEIFRLIQ